MDTFSVPKTGNFVSTPKQMKMYPLYCLDLNIFACRFEFLLLIFVLSVENINSLQNWDCWKQIGRKFYQNDCIRPCIALIKKELLNFQTIARSQ